MKLKFIHVSVKYFDETDLRPKFGLQSIFTIVVGLRQAYAGPLVF